MFDRRRSGRHRLVTGRACAYWYARSAGHLSARYRRGAFAGANGYGYFCQPRSSAGTAFQHTTGTITHFSPAQFAALPAHRNAGPGPNLACAKLSDAAGNGGTRVRLVGTAALVGTAVRT